MSSKDNSVATNVALEIKRIVEELQKDLAQDIREIFEEDFYRLLEILAGQMPKSEVDAILPLCREVHDGLTRPRRNTQRNRRLADPLMRRITEMSARPCDKELGPEVEYGRLAPRSVFEVVSGEVKELHHLAKHAQAKGCFLRFSNGSIHSVGLEGSSHEGLPVMFTSQSIVREVIRQNP